MQWKKRLPEVAHAVWWRTSTQAMTQANEKTRISEDARTPSWQFRIEGGKMLWHMQWEYSTYRLSSQNLRWPFSMTDPLCYSTLFVFTTKSAFLLQSRNISFTFLQKISDHEIFNIFAVSFQKCWSHDFIWQMYLFVWNLSECYMIIGWIRDCGSIFKREFLTRNTTLSPTAKIIQKKSRIDGITAFCVRNSQQNFEI